MMDKTFIFVMGLMVVSLCSCEGNTPDPSARKPVIEAYISSGETPVVLFSSSIEPEQGGSLSDALINWGKVTISDGDKEIVLTGEVNNSYIPPFMYFTDDMVGQEGKTYTITAKFKDLYAETQSKILPSTPIDDIYIKKTENDTLYTMTLSFTAPEIVPAYYYVSIRGLERNDVDRPCFMSTYRALNPGEKCTIPIIRPKNKIEEVDYIPNFVLGEEFILSLNRIEPSVYDFWQAYENMMLVNTSPFISSSVTLAGNIDGGYGVFSAQGSSKIKVKIR